MTVAAAVLILIVSAGSAHAYVDPGAGLFFLQILAAIGVGGLFYLRRLRSALKKFFGGKGNRDETPDQS